MFNFEDKLIESEWKEAKKIIDSTDIFSKEGDGGVNVGDQKALFFISKYINPKTTLEIGTHIACSTIALALGSEGIVYTVDKKDVIATDGPWKKHGRKVPPNISMERNNIRNVRFRTTEEFDFKTANLYWDLIFIDGNHSKDGFISDVTFSRTKLNADGLIVFHDYYPEGKPIWEGKKPIKGPYEACVELGIDPIPLYYLPWETKLGTNKTSLAVIKF